MRITTSLPSQPAEPASPSGDRSLLLERAVAGLAHEAKNPLHNMSLHLQLVSEKLAQAAAARVPVPPDASGRGGVERHLQALRDGIARVDALLRAFAEFAAPEQALPDLGAALSRAHAVLGYEARRAGVGLSRGGLESLAVALPMALLADLLGHALLACIALARDGGRVATELTAEGGRARMQLRCEGGTARPAEAEVHLEAARRLAAALSIDLQLEAGGQAGARLSLLVPLPA